MLEDPLQLIVIPGLGSWESNHLIYQTGSRT